MIAPRAPRVSWRRRAFQRLQRWITVGHWPARLAYASGGQQPVTVWHEHITLGGTGPALRIAFAADFHAGPSTHPRVLESACAELARLEAPVLLLGGDFVCLSAADLRQIVPRLAEIPAPLGKYAVLGNHDYWAGAPHVIGALEAAGIRVLLNESVRLPAPFAQVAIAGLDDPIAGHPDPHRMLADAAPRRIVLMHAPSGLRALGQAPFDLALCGHTHGGQIALPGARPLYVPEAREFRRFAAGRFALEGNRVLFVSRGVGYSTAPLRSFCPSEILGLEVAFTPQRRPSGPAAGSGAPAPHADGS